jgi:hypothetical protein
MDVKKITHHSQLIAVIIRGDTPQKGIEFYTPDDSGQQIGAMSWPAGHEVLPHIHNHVERTVSRTQEVLVIRKGRARIDLYDEQKNYLESHIVVSGDIIFLAGGGHGVTMLDDTVMVEIKQGPYAGERDKTRFDPVDDSRLDIKT